MHFYEYTQRKKSPALRVESRGFCPVLFLLSDDLLHVVALLSSYILASDWSAEPWILNVRLRYRFSFSS